MKWASGLGLGDRKPEMKHGKKDVIFLLVLFSLQITLASTRKVATACIVPWLVFFSGFLAGSFLSSDILWRFLIFYFFSVSYCVSRSCVLKICRKVLNSMNVVFLLFLFFLFFLSSRYLSTYIHPVIG